MYIYPQPSMTRRITGGSLTGFMGIALMLTPWEFTEGSFVIRIKDIQFTERI